MDSLMNVAKDVLSKGKGLGKNNVIYEADAIKKIHDAYKLQQTQIKKVKLPVNDSPPISPYIELQNAENELQTTNRRLIRKRKGFVVRQKYLGSQWLELGQNEKALKENFITFSKFLRTNLEKRERAERKIQSDAENVRNRSAEIDQLKNKYNCRKQEFLMMKNEIKKHSIYQTFLEKVIGLANAEFKDIEDLPKRMEVLLIAKEKLDKHQADQLSRLECSKRVMTQFMESKILQIIGLNTTIASLRYRYDDAVKRTIELDNMVVDLKTTALKYATDLSANKESILNMYQQICLKHNINAKQKKKDVINQLLEINHSMMGYGKIYELMRRRGKREKKLQ